MRVWRVGTISMGITLILLGTVLLFSNWMDVSMYDLFLSWWPFLLIVVGAEMLIYLKQMKKEDARIKYDFLSIFFVGIIGTIALSFMFLSFSGLDEEVKYGISQKTEYTNDLPLYSGEVEAQYNRVVLKLNGYPLNVEASDGAAVEVFGTYQSLNEESVLATANDYLHIHLDGDTLYVSFKKLPETKGVYSSYQSRISPTILIPNELELEVRGSEQYEQVKLYPSKLLSNWTVQNVSQVETYVSEASDLVIMSEQIWINDEEEKQHEFVIGNGENLLSIAKGSAVLVYMQP